MSDIKLREIRRTVPSAAHASRRADDVAPHGTGTALNKEEKPKIVIQTNLTDVRCGHCNALLAKATSGSVLGIVCGRCKTYNFVEVSHS
jgi:hypothetical protein